MKPHVNSFGQPIGWPVPNWKPVPLPPRTSIEGQYCTIESIDPARHAAALFAAVAEDKTGSTWTYLPYGPFAALADYEAWMASTCLGEDPMFWAILDRGSERPLGVASFLRIDAKLGVIEVGHIHYAPRLQRTRMATEAMYLLMRRVFDELGYRRYEWKCDALNEPSCMAARRLGFTYEGTFRQAAIYKGRNRDTAWFAIIDREWPALKRAYETWLDPANFDAEGNQKRSLGGLTAEALEEARGPGRPHDAR